jgi:hypothetical protein
MTDGCSSPPRRWCAARIRSTRQRLEADERASDSPSSDAGSIPDDTRTRLLRNWGRSGGRPPTPRAKPGLARGLTDPSSTASQIRLIAGLEDSFREDSLMPRRQIGVDCGCFRYRSPCLELPFAVARRTAAVRLHLDPASSGHPETAAIGLSSALRSGVRKHTSPLIAIASRYGCDRGQTDQVMSVRGLLKEGTT